MCAVAASRRTPCGAYGGSYQISETLLRRHLNFSTARRTLNSAWCTPRSVMMILAAVLGLNLSIRRIPKGFFPSRIRAIVGIIRGPEHLVSPDAANSTHFVSIVNYDPRSRTAVGSPRRADHSASFVSAAADRSTIATRSSADGGQSPVCGARWPWCR